MRFRPGLGVLQDKKLSHVPGTATLRDLQGPGAVETGHKTNLKYSKNGILLVPQPSDADDDPLNLPLWRRDLITLVLCIQSVIASTLSPLLAANTLTLTLYFERSFTDVALLTGWHLFGVGISGFFFVASARVWGKRHVYLAGIFIIVISSIWAGLSNENYNSLMAARVFQGVGLAPFEALVNASVGDLYFVHERGARMALTNLCLYGGAFLTPVIAGQMTHSLNGWQWTCYLVAIFSAACAPFFFFFVPETAYLRDAKWNIDTTKISNSATPSEAERASSSGGVQEHTSLDKDNFTPSDNFVSEHPTPNPPALFDRRNWRIFTGVKEVSHQSGSTGLFFKLLVRPIPLFFHPAFFWACLIQGALIGWTVFIGIALAAIMLAPPLLFNEVQTGFMYTGPFVGALLGFIIAGLLADSSAAWLTKLNNGVYEPEFRMILVIPQLIIGGVGLYGFGITANDPFAYGWFWPDFFFAWEVCGMVVGAVASALYIVDAYRDLSVEGFTCLLVFKNIFSFGLTYSGYDWLVQGTIPTVFYWISSVQVVICLLTIPMYVFGKQLRSFMARNDIEGAIGKSVNTAYGKVFRRKK